MHPIASAFAQILGKSGNTVGSGFLLNSSTICTCAHVYAQALGQPELKLAAEPPNIPVSFLLPFVSPDIYTGTLRSWSPDLATGCDAALLSVEAKLPITARELPVVLANDATGAPFEVHGFQTGTAFDVNANGRIGAQNARGWYELIGVGAQGFFVQPGFSGGPVWDVAQQAGIGIIKAVANDAAIRVAFLIPSESLVRYLSGFRISTISSRGLAFGRNRYDLFVSATRREPTAREVIVRYLSDLVPATTDPTQRYWIYEALGDIGGDLARLTVLRALEDETDELARSGVENAARTLCIAKPRGM
jgi:hypothetical protein